MAKGMELLAVRILLNYEALRFCGRLTGGPLSESTDRHYHG